MTTFPDALMFDSYDQSFGYKITTLLEGKTSEFTIQFYKGKCFLDFYHMFENTEKSITVLKNFIVKC